MVGVDGTGQIRYGMHDLVRTYCRERMAEEETADMAVSVVSSAARHLLRLAAEARSADRGHDYYARLAGELAVAVDERTVRHAAEHAVNWLEAEAATVHGVLRQTEAHGLFGEGWRIALMGGWLYDIRCWAGEYRKILTIAYRMAEKSGDRRAQAIVPALSAELGVLARRPGRGRADARVVRTDLRRDRGRARAGGGLADARHPGAHAWRAHRRAAPLRADPRDLPRHGGPLGRGPHPALRRADPPRRGSRARGAAVSGGGPPRRGQEPRRLEAAQHPVLAGRGLPEGGTRGEARDAFLKVAEAADRVGDFTGGAFARLGLAHVAIEAGERRQARTLLAAALDHAERSELALVLCKIGLAVGEALARLGELARAGETIERVLPGIDGLASPPMRAEAMALLARVREGQRVARV
ncbi:hypothetical protein ACFSTC_59190 [Nonomuraea ferruginea]